MPYKPPLFREIAYAQIVNGISEIESIQQQHIIIIIITTLPQRSVKSSYAWLREKKKP